VDDARVAMFMLITSYFELLNEESNHEPVISCVRIIQRT